MTDELIEMMAEGMHAQWRPYKAWPDEPEKFQYRRAAMAALDSLTAAGCEVVKLPGEQGRGRWTQNPLESWMPMAHEDDTDVLVRPASAASPKVCHALVAAAREALKPLWELHKRWPMSQFCRVCRVNWPCDTAKLIYTTEELGR